MQALKRSKLACLQASATIVGVAQVSVSLKGKGYCSITPPTLPI